MKLRIVLCATLLAAAPAALADGMPDGPHGWHGGHGGYGERIGPRRHGWRPRAHHRHGHGHHYGYGAPSAHAAAFYPGAGEGAPDGPVLVAEYREPYIGRGLVYNVPPDPWAYRSGAVISAKY